MLNGFWSTFSKTMTYFQIPQTMGMVRVQFIWHVYSLFANGITFWAYAEQGRMILVNTPNNEKCDSGANSPCKPLQPNDPLETPRAIYGECFSSPPLLWMCGITTSYNARETAHVALAWIISKAICNCVPQNQAGSSFPYFLSSTPRVYGHCEHFSNHMFLSTIFRTKESK